jgi:hypothetical protein
MTEEVVAEELIVAEDVVLCCFDKSSVTIH